MSYITKIKSLYQREGVQKYLKNTSWLFFEKSLRIVAGLVVGSWVSRYLGPSDYGAFQFSISIITVFSAIATLGIDQIVIRELVKDESKRGALLGTAFTIKLIGATASLVILIACIPLASLEPIINKMILIIASSMLLHSFNVIDFHFQSKVLSKYVVYSNIISLLLTSIIKIILIVVNASLIAFAIVTVFEALILAMGYIYYYFNTSKSVSFKNWKFSKGIAQQLLSESWPLVFGSVVITLQSRIDQVMLKGLISNKEVGYYSAAMRLIEMLGFIPLLLLNSLLPSLINSKKASMKLYKSRLLNFYRLNSIFFFLTAIPIFLLSKWIILFLYGEEYSPAIPLLAFMTLRILIDNLGIARSGFINIENLFRFSLLTMVIGTTVNVILNYYLIPTYQAMGAVFSTLTSFAITIFVIDFFYSKTRVNVLMQLKSVLTFYAIKLDFLKKEGNTLNDESEG